MIRFDLPGIGGSPLPVVPYHMTTLAPLVGQLVRQLGHEQVDVLGFSWGGGLAQQFAVSQAEQCRRLVLVGTGTGLIMVPGRPQVLAKMLTPRRHRDPGYARRIAAELYGGTMRTHPERAAEVLHAGARHGPRPRLLLPAAGRVRLEHAAGAGADPAAHADRGRGRRPDHPDDQREDHAAGHPGRADAHLPGRAPGAADRGRPSWPR